MYIYIYIYVYVCVCRKPHMRLIGARSRRVNNSPPASLTLGLGHDQTPDALNCLAFVYSADSNVNVASSKRTKRRRKTNKKQRGKGKHKEEENTMKDKRACIISLILHSRTGRVQDVSTMHRLRLVRLLRVWVSEGLTQADS